jgi:competence protein ComEC
LLLLKKLGSFVTVSFFAITGTLPLLLYYFNQVSMVGLLSNCIAVPIVGFLILPLGLLAMLILPLSFPLALCVMQGNGMIVSILLAAVSYFSSWPFAAIKMVTPTLFEIGLFYAMIVALLHITRKLWVRIGVLPLLLVLILGDVLYWVDKRFWCQELRTTVIDVGHGNAALLELPKGTCILVDGGGFFDHSFDVGRFVVAPFLWQKKIATIDYVVLSHPQADHLNGLLYVARNFNVREVWSNGQSGQTETYQAFLEILSEEDIPLVRLHRNSTPKIINGVRFDILHPSVDFLSHADGIPCSNRNNNSLVFKASLGETAFLFPGDIEAEGERELAFHAGNTLKSTILLAPHHGSRTSSTPLFLDCVQPNIVIFSARPNNRFTLPHPEVLNRYAMRNCEILRTDRDGAIMITTDGKEVKIEVTDKNSRQGKSS